MQTLGVLAGLVAICTAADVVQKRAAYPYPGIYNPVYTVGFPHYLNPYFPYEPEEAASSYYTPRYNNPNYSPNYGPNYSPNPYPSGPPVQYPALKNGTIRQSLSDEYQ